MTVQGIPSLTSKLHHLCPPNHKNHVFFASYHHKIYTKISNLLVCHKTDVKWDTHFQVVHNFKKIVVICLFSDATMGTDKHVFTVKHNRELMKKVWLYFDASNGPNNNTFPAKHNIKVRKLWLSVPPLVLQKGQISLPDTI